jgi:hypothetical protein
LSLDRESSNSRARRLLVCKTGRVYKWEDSIELRTRTRTCVCLARRPAGYGVVGGEAVHKPSLCAAPQPLPAAYPRRARIVSQRNGRPPIKPPRHPHRRAFVPFQANRIAPKRQFSINFPLKKHIAELRKFNKSRDRRERRVPRKGRVSAVSQVACCAAMQSDEAGTHHLHKKTMT